MTWRGVAFPMPRAWNLRVAGSPAAELKALDRYRLLVELSAKSGSLWALTSSAGDGFVTFADPRNHVVVPFWPTPEDASEMATGDWLEAVPTEVPVRIFLEREVAGMEADGVLIAAFPTRRSSGAAVRAAHFARALRDALEGARSA
jgi:hypothetical protein